jgi:3-oxoacyl-[acyl-carrier protein] reductase
MNLELTDKVALVTGSSGGIGRTIAQTLAAEGVRVVVHGRRQSGVDETVMLIRKAGGDAAGAVGDLADDAHARSVAEAASAAFGGVDVLINNAGTFENRHWADLAPADWLHTYNNNIVSAVRVAQALAPAMKARGWGRLIHISTLEARQPLEVMGDYASAKAALATMSVHLSKVFAQSGITSNVVSPGIIVTEAVKTFFTKLAADRGWGVSDWPEIERRILATEYPIAAGRLGLPQDVADAVAFLASPRSQYINAAHLMIDGGLVGTVI